MTLYFDTNHGKAVNIIKTESCISSIPQELYIVIAKAVSMHTYGVMIYKGGTPPLMIYTLKRDDIPLLSQWIKNSDAKASEFLVRVTGVKNPAFRGMIVCF